MKASSVKSVRCAIYPGQFHSQSSSAQNQQNPHWSLTVSSNLCVAVPDGATELERLRDRNQGIAPPSNADLIAIIRAKDDLICQLKTAALETDRLRDHLLGQNPIQVGSTIIYDVGGATGRHKARRKAHHA